MVKIGSSLSQGIRYTMTIRERTEEKEKKILSQFAVLSCESKGRSRTDEACPIRTVFQHDRDRILHSKAFRRLKYKTQVFLSPEGDHYRTRLTHTLEVAQIARTVARALSLNEDLTEAIALGHDLGHTPFGHAGEDVLNDLLPSGFRHANQSLRVVDSLEKNGAGLNLTQEVRAGILGHSKGGGPLYLPERQAGVLSLEAQVVRIADIVAYVNHDTDDALRSGVVSRSDVPSDLLNALGKRHSERIGRMVCDLVESSLQEGGQVVRMSDRTSEAILALRNWLLKHVYRAEAVHADFRKAKRVLSELFGFFLENEQKLLDNGGLRLPDDPLEVSVADFIAGMTDRFALTLYDSLFIPKPWKQV